MKLFEIGNELHTLADLLEETGGEITEANSAAVDQWFKELEDNQGEKLDKYIWLIAETDGLRAVAQSQADIYQKAAKVRANTVEALKRRLFDYLRYTNQTKVVTPTGRELKVVGNGGSKPIDISPTANPDNIPQEFVKVVMTKSIDTAKVRAALESGEVLEFASMRERGQRLAIK